MNRTLQSPPIREQGGWGHDYCSLLVGGFDLDFCVRGETSSHNAGEGSLTEERGMHLVLVECWDVPAVLCVWGRGDPGAWPEQPVIITEPKESKPSLTGLLGNKRSHSHLCPLVLGPGLSDLRGKNTTHWPWNLTS